jgi:creatinine amidohydrolase
MLANCTYEDVADQLRTSQRVLVPVGSTEQHGPHGALGTDVILAMAVCQRVAPMVNALIAPAIPFGVSDEHLGFPGVLSVGADTLSALVVDVVRSLASGGFRRIVLINGHNTNLVILHAAVARANQEITDDAACYWLSYWDALPPAERDAYLGMSAGIHANEGETSATLAVDPDLIDATRLAATWPGELAKRASPAALQAYLFSGRAAFADVVPSGTWGDPTDASRERGEQYLDAAANGVRQVIDEVDELLAIRDPSR